MATAVNSQPAVNTAAMGKPEAKMNSALEQISSTSDVERCTADCRNEPSDVTATTREASNLCCCCQSLLHAHLQHSLLHITCSTDAEDNWTVLWGVKLLLGSTSSCSTSAALPHLDGTAAAAAHCSTAGVPAAAAAVLLLLLAEAAWVVTVLICCHLDITLLLVFVTGA